LELYTTVKDIGRPSCVALGLFDGVHRGHREVIKKAVSYQSEGLCPVIFTFSVHSMKPERKISQATILSDSLKFQLFEELGVEKVITPKFEDIMPLDAKSFVKDILHDKLKARVVVCGYDFHFGKNASADAQFLSQEAKKYGIETCIIPALVDQGEPVSSTRIRNLILQGQVGRANELLGYDYCIDFVVKKGMQLGNSIGFPTINQEFPQGFLVPKYGVYATTVKVFGRRFFGVTNVGVKPTIEGERLPSAETHILDFNEDLYGKKVQVYFTKYLRDEKKFDTIEELSLNIKKDAEMAKQLFNCTNKINIC
jgi:riboflavin kinase/FMN adenylyltransferase